MLENDLFFTFSIKHLRGIKKMAKMHSRKRGVSGSKKPARKNPPSWERYKAKEAELLITKLGKEGKTSSQIGMVLRDTYGVPDAKLLIGKNITQVMAEKNLLPKFPEDVVALMKRAILVRKHLEANKQDMAALRGKQLTDAKIKRLVKYYKRMGKIAADWKYDPTQLKMYTE
jgi:small subunit ribosomal protein S15